MGVRRIVAFASTALAVAAACSTFEEGNGSSGNDAGEGGTGHVDGPAGYDSATAADAADAGGDAWVPCLSRDADASHFCDDFDRQGAITFGWNNLIVAGGASGDFFTEGTSGTPPKSFRALLPSSTNPPGRAQLRLVRPVPSSRYRLEFDVRVDAIPHPTGTAGFAHLAVIELDDAPCFTGATKQRSVELSLIPNGERVLVYTKGLQPCPAGDAAANSTSADFAITPSQLVDGKFRHVSITIEKASCPGTQSKMSMYTALGDLKSACHELAVDGFAESVNIAAYVGAYVGSAAYANTAFVYDNITVDLD